MDTPLAAPDWQVSEWLNTDTPLTLEALRGRVVVLHAFQMLCRGCVLHAVPQAERVHRLVSRDDVAVVGLHTVFEHHDVMTPAALRVFLHEFRVTHPIGVDVADPGEPIPRTMRAYRMQGTPTLMLIDRQGRLRTQQFGQLDDFALAAAIMRLVKESRRRSSSPRTRRVRGFPQCGHGYCVTGRPDAEHGERGDVPAVDVLTLPAVSAAVASVAPL